MTHSSPVGLLAHPTRHLFFAVVERARREQPYFDEVVRIHSSRTAGLSWLACEPVGAAGRGRLF